MPLSTNNSKRTLRVCFSSTSSLSTASTGLPACARLPHQCTARGRDIRARTDLGQRRGLGQQRVDLGGEVLLLLLLAHRAVGEEEGGSRVRRPDAYAFCACATLDCIISSSPQTMSSTWAARPRFEIEWAFSERIWTCMRLHRTFRPDIMRVTSSSFERCNTHTLAASPRQVSAESSSPACIGALITCTSRMASAPISHCPQPRARFP
jgi:hypothetical protein